MRLCDCNRKFRRLDGHLRRLPPGAFWENKGEVPTMGAHCVFGCPPLWCSDEKHRFFFFLSLCVVGAYCWSPTQTQCAAVISCRLAQLALRLGIAPPQSLVFLFCFLFVFFPHQVDLAGRIRDKSFKREKQSLVGASHSIGFKI